MALHRCAACGSPNVVTDTQKEGYDYVKGAIGTVALGVGGAAAGINGKTKKVFKCPDCGLTLSEPMDRELQMLIEAGLISEGVRDGLRYKGIPMPWSYVTDRFKNIDPLGHISPTSTLQPITHEVPASGAEPVYTESEQREHTTIRKASLTQEEVTNNQKKYIGLLQEYRADLNTWREQVDQIISTIRSEEEATLLAEKNKMEQLVINKIDTENREYNKSIQNLEAKKAEATNKLQSMGFCNLFAKKECRNSIAKIEEQITREESAHIESQKRLEQERENISKQLEEICVQIHNQMLKKYTFPSRPVKTMFLYEHNITGHRNEAAISQEWYLSDVIFAYLEMHGKVRRKELEEYVQFVMTNESPFGPWAMNPSSGVSACVRNNPDIIQEDVLYYRVNYRTKNEYEEEKSNVLKDKTVELIYEVIKRRNGAFTIRQLGCDEPALNGISNQKIASTLRTLCGWGFVERFILKEKAATFAFIH